MLSANLQNTQWQCSLHEEDETLLFSTGQDAEEKREQKEPVKCCCLKHVSAAVFSAFALSLPDDVPIRTWFPKENLFSFQTATTTMQA